MKRPWSSDTAAISSDPERAEVRGEGMAVRPPCCLQEVLLSFSQFSPRHPRRLLCLECQRAWRLDLFADAQAGWVASWQLVWSEPAQPRRGWLR
ncbi:MAG: hypothetical protein ACRDZ4_16440 [Egibacteraceae bacterium]